MGEVLPAWERPGTVGHTAGGLRKRALIDYRAATLPVAPRVSVRAARACERRLLKLEAASMCLLPGASHAADAVTASGMPTRGRQDRRRWMTPLAAAAGVDGDPRWVLLSLEEGMVHMDDDLANSKLFSTTVKTQRRPRRRVAGPASRAQTLGKTEA